MTEYLFRYSRNLQGQSSIIISKKKLEDLGGRKKLIIAIKAELYADLIQSSIGRVLNVQFSNDENNWSTLAALPKGVGRSLSLANKMSATKFDPLKHRKMYYFQNLSLQFVRNFPIEGYYKDMDIQIYKVPATKFSSHSIQKSYFMNLW